MATGFLALLDDVAAIAKVAAASLDDTAAAAAKASAKAAGVVIDAIRCCKLALDRGIAGPLLGPSAYFMKSPPTQFTDDVAHDMVEEFIAG